MKRCYPVSKGLLKFLDKQENLEIKRDFSLIYERVHALGSARAASILSAKRGVDIELAHAAGALHDFGRIITGKNEGHALQGYEPVKEFLARLSIFHEQEIEEISLAVKNHSRKDLVGSPLGGNRQRQRHPGHLLLRHKVKERGPLSAFGRLTKGNRILTTPFVPGPWFPPPFGPYFRVSLGCISCLQARRMPQLLGRKTWWLRRSGQKRFSMEGYE